MTYREIAAAVVTGFEDLDDQKTEDTLYFVGLWIDGDGNRAMEFPDAEPIEEWSGDDDRLLEYLILHQAVLPDGTVRG